MASVENLKTERQFTPSEAAMDIALSEAGFVHGAQACREMMARFVENSAPTDPKVLAGSIRANWHPGWGVDPGRLSGNIPDNPLGDLATMIELLDIDREAESDGPAAPELYEACEGVLARFEAGENLSSLEAEWLREALAKARGK